MSRVKNLFKNKFRKSTADLSEWSKSDVKLLQAVDNDDIERVRHLLSKRTATATKLDPQGRTVLHVCSTDGKLGILVVLIQHAADLSSLDGQGRTALHCAARHGWPEVVQALLQCECPVYVADNNQLTALHHVCIGGDLSSLKLLLEAKAPVNSTDKDLRTPLFFCAQMGYTDMCRELLGHNAQINAQDTEGRTPLMLAAEHGSKEVCDLLVKRGAHVSLMDNMGRNASWYAINAGHSDIKYILDTAPSVASWDIVQEDPVTHQPEQVDFIDSFDVTGEESPPVSRRRNSSQNVSSESLNDSNWQARYSNGVANTQSGDQADTFKEIEEENELLNEELSQLNTAHKKLQKRLQDLQDRLNEQHSNSLDASLVDSLEEEIRNLNEQLTEERERREELEDELQHLKVKISLQKSSEELCETDSWGESDEDIFEDTRNRRSASKKMNKQTSDKQLIAILRSQIMSLNKESNLLKKGTKQNGPRTSDSEGITGISLVDVADNGPAGRAIVAKLVKQIADLEDRIEVIKGQGQGNVVPVEQYQEMELANKEEVKKLVRQISELEGDVLSTRQDREEFINELSQTHETEITELRKKIFKLEDTLSSYKQSDITVPYTNNNKIGKVSENHIKTLQCEIEKLKERLESRDSDLRNFYEVEVKTLKSQIEDLTSGRSQMEDLSSGRNQQAVGNGSHEMAEWQKTMKNLDADVLNLSGQVDTVPLTRFLELENTSEEQITLQKTQIVILEDEISSLSTQLTEITDENIKLLCENTSLKEDIVNTKHEFDNLNSELRSASKSGDDNNELRNEIHTLQSMQTFVFGLVAEKESLSAKVDELTKTISQINDELATKGNQLYTCTAENTKLNLKIQELNNEQPMQSPDKSKTDQTERQKSVIKSNQILIKKLNNELSASSEALVKQNKEINDLRVEIKKVMKDKMAAEEELEKKIDILNAQQTVMKSGHHQSSLQKHITKLQKQLLETERRHKEVVATYRTHLISAVQGQMDPDIQQAIYSIIQLRSNEQFC